MVQTYLAPLQILAGTFINECDQEQNKAVAANGLRIDINMSINREHPEFLLPNIPIERTVFCIFTWSGTHCGEISYVGS